MIGFKMEETWKSVENIVKALEYVVADAHEACDRMHKLEDQMNMMLHHQFGQEHPTFEEGLPEHDALREVNEPRGEEDHEARDDHMMIDLTK
jgi:hypothetical protein